MTMTAQTSQHTNQTHKHANMRTMGIEVDSEEGRSVVLSLNFVLFKFVFVDCLID